MGKMTISGQTGRRQGRRATRPEQGQRRVGVAYNARILATIAEHIAPAIGWTPTGVAAAA
jgi:hypothetical protein